MVSAQTYKKVACSEYTKRNSKYADIRSQYVDYEYDYAKIPILYYIEAQVDNPQRIPYFPPLTNRTTRPKMESNEKIYYFEIQMKKGCKIHIYTHGINTYMYILTMMDGVRSTKKGELSESKRKKETENV